MSDTEQKQETPQKPDVIGGCLALILAAVVVISFATSMFWPWTTEGVVQRVNYTWDTRAIVTFDDGRSISLRGHPTRSLTPGKYYKITYNTLKYFYDVEEVEK